MSKGREAGIAGYFQLAVSGTTVNREIRAGLTTFLTMSYILFVNPQILGQAIPISGAGPQLLTATAIAAAFGSLLMGFMSRYPYALAPGMGLNAYFTYTVVLGQGVPWQTALGAVFISGLLFFCISLAGIRQALIDAIPRGLKYATTAGIGMFLALIGMVNGGLVVDNPATLVSLGNPRDPNVLLTLFGLLLTTIMLILRTRGAILIGIFTTTLLAALVRAPVFSGKSFAGFPDGIVALPVWPSDLFLAADLSGAIGLGLLTIVFTFLFVDFFDSTGTLIGLSEKVGKLDEAGRMPNSRAAFCADALATSFGALFGTSSTTCYIESAAGIEDGGRTGLTAIVVAGLFLLSIFFWPLAGAVPSVATASTLMVVGAMMMFTCARIKWQDYSESVPAMLTMLGMPLTFSITNGIALGLVSYTLLKLFSGQGKTLSVLMYVLTVLLILRFAFLLGG